MLNLLQLIKTKCFHLSVSAKIFQQQLPWKRKNFHSLLKLQVQFLNRKPKRKIWSALMLWWTNRRPLKLMSPKYLNSTLQTSLPIKICNCIILTILTSLNITWYTKASINTPISLRIIWWPKTDPSQCPLEFKGSKWEDILTKAQFR